MFSTLMSLEDRLSLKLMYGYNAGPYCVIDISDTAYENSTQLWCEYTLMSTLKRSDEHPGHYAPHTDLELLIILTCHCLMCSK